MSYSNPGTNDLHLGRYKNSGGHNSDFGYNDRMVLIHLLSMLPLALPLLFWSVVFIIKKFLCHSVS